jgi:hypothetical protein
MSSEQARSKGDRADERSNHRECRSFFRAPALRSARRRPQGDPCHVHADPLVRIVDCPRARLARHGLCARARSRASFGDRAVPHLVRPSRRIIGCTRDASRWCFAPRLDGRALGWIGRWRRHGGALDVTGGWMPHRHAQRRERLRYDELRVHAHRADAVRRPRLLCESPLGRRHAFYPRRDRRQARGVRKQGPRFPSAHPLLARRSRRASRPHRGNPQRVTGIRGMVLDEDVALWLRVTSMVMIGS